MSENGGSPGEAHHREPTGACKWAAAALLGAGIVVLPLHAGGTTYPEVTWMRLWGAAALGLGVWRVSSHLLWPQAGLGWVLALLALATAWGLGHAVNVFAATQAAFDHLLGAFIAIAAAFVGRYRGPRTVLLGAVFLAAWLQGGLSWFQRLALGLPRSLGTFFSPNDLAAFLAPAAVVALAAGIAGGRGWRQGLALATSAFAASSVLWTGSRGGVLSMLAGAVTVIALTRPPWLTARRLAGAAAVAGVALAVIPNPLTERLRTAHRDLLFYGRLAIWAQSAEMFAAHPRGTGLASYRYLSGPFDPPSHEPFVTYGRHTEQPHSSLISAVVEMGPPGVALVLVAMMLLGVTLGRARTLIRSRAGPLDLRASAPTAADIAGAAGAVTGMGIHACVDSLLRHQYLMVIFALWAGLLGAQTAPRAVPLPIPGRQRRAIQFGAVLTLLALWAGTWPAYQAFQLSVEGTAFYRAGRFADAATAYQEALRKAPGQFVYWMGYAEVLDALCVRERQAQACEPAFEALARGRAIMPAAVNLHIREGRMALERHGFDGGQRWFDLARKAFGRAQAWQPHNAVAAAYLAETEIVAGNTGAAHARLSEVLAMEPNFLWALERLESLNAGAPEEAQWSERLAGICRQIGPFRAQDEYQRTILGQGAEFRLTRPCAARLIDPRGPGR